MSARKPKILPALFAVALTACATEPQQAPTPVAPSPKKISSENIAPTLSDTAELAQFQKLYDTQSYGPALAKMEEFEARHPKSGLQMQVENLRGLCLILTHHPAAAAGQFMSALQKCPESSPILPYLKYNLAKARYESGDIEGASSVANQIVPASMDSSNQAKFHFLRAEIFGKQDKHAEATKELISIAPTPVTGAPGSDEQNKLVRASLETELSLIKESSSLEPLAHAYPDSPYLDAVLFRLGELEIAEGHGSRGEDDLHALISRFPNSAFAPRANDLISNSIRNRPVEQHKVGVLLPLKGKFARFGQANLAAIEQAFGIFGNSGSPDSRDSQVELVLQDSGETPEQAIRALDALVNQYHVAAVIGPLLSKGVDQVSKHAEDLGVPMISLARHSGSGTASDHYVVQAGITIQTQAQSIARFAIQTRGLRKFAILYPKDKVGEESAQDFWDAVESLGGEVVGIESYTPNDTDFRVVVDKLSGLFYTDARQREIDNLAEQRKQNQIKKRTRKSEKFFALPPIVDYEAVFIADEPKVTGQIMPTFAYRDVDHVQFLGGSAWNSQELIQRAQTYAEGALFVDAFFPGDDSTDVRKFIGAFNSEFGVNPSAMDALAYDAAIVLRDAMESAGSSFSRSDLLDKIRSTRDLRGVTGKITFKDGQLSRDLMLLSIKGGQIVIEAGGARNGSKEMDKTL